MLAMNQMVGTFWSRFTCQRTECASEEKRNLSVMFWGPNLCDGGVLDVDVDQGEVLAGVAVHQVDELGVATDGDGRSWNFDLMNLHMK